MGMKIAAGRQGAAFVPSKVTIAFATPGDEEMFRMFLRGMNSDFCRQVLDAADTDWLIENEGAPERVQAMLDALAGEYAKLG